ncbi:MAG: Hpt domain-containing protein, partial [Pseudomonadota bacterium]|nr:Hpt domain-containing protein [Pseudomonadota bacterium]
MRDAPTHLSQMRGVLSVLGLDQASQAVLRMREAVEEMLVDEVDEEKARTAGTFDKLGNNLGALGFLIDMLNYQPALAKKLFVYDDHTGELKPLMGRAAHSLGEAAAGVSLGNDMLMQEVASVVGGADAAAAPADLSAKLDTLAGHAALAGHVGMAQAAREASAAVNAKDPTAATAALSELAAVMQPAAVPAPVAATAPATEDLDEEDIRDIFLEEAREVVQNALAALDTLAANPSDLAELTTLRRAFHTLKGSSRMVGLTEFGEAGWSMEQVLNAWLAEQKPASNDLRTLAADAMRGFGLWVEDIAAGTDGAWGASQFRTAADAMRGEQRLVPLVFRADSAAAPKSEAVPDGFEAVALPRQIAPVRSLDLPSKTSVPLDGAEAPLDGVERSLADAGLPDFSFDELEPAQAAQPSTEEISAEQALDFGFDFGDAPVAAPVPAPAASIDGIDLAGLAEVSNSARRDVASGALDLPQNGFMLSGLMPELAPLPNSAPFVDSESALADEGVKVIGSLRIGIPLYNVYLNEADEWSRRLETEVSEWALELNQPMPDSTVGLAHALAGSSATVGFDALSDVARALEGALGRTQLLAYGTAAHGKAFIAAAEDIRRLLHQFAAGFLKEPNARVTAALQQLDDIDVPKRAEQVEREEIARSGFGSLDLLASGAPLPAAVPPPPHLAAVPVAHGPIAPAATMSIAPAAAAGPRNLDDEHDAIDVTDVIDPDLFPIFEEEAGELLPQLGGALRQWVARPDNRGARDEVLRALHTLKGSARLAGAMRLGEMSHRMESEIEEFGLEGVKPSDLELLLQRLDAMQA